MVVAAAVTYGLAFNNSQAWCGFAGVHDARLRALDGLHIAGGLGGDARHALGEVQGDALGTEHCA